MRTLGRATFAALLVSSAAFAQVTAKQEVEEGPVGAGDPFRMTVSVSGAEHEAAVRLPPGDFQVLGRSRSTNVTMSSSPSGMETQRTEQFIFTLRANKPGRLVIPAAEIVADGERLASEPVSVEVQREHVARPRAEEEDDADPFASMLKQFGGFGGATSLGSRFFGQDPFEIAAPIRPGEVRLEAVADRKTAFPGQQITVSFYLYARVPLASVNGLQPPAFEGAAVRDLPPGKRLAPEQRDGEARVLIARKAIFANAAGPLVIQRATATVAAEDGQEVSVTSEPLRLQIDPLPPGPSNPAVGTWALSFEGPSLARAGEPATFKIGVSGFGDLASLPTPAPAFPKAWKVFPPSTTETETASGTRAGGVRTWELVAVPSGAGAVRLPPIELQSFDPQTKRYAVLRSEPLEVQVGAAATVAAESPPPPAKPLAGATGSLWRRAAPVGLVALFFVAALFFAAALFALLTLLRKHARRSGASPGGASLTGARRELDAARSLCEGDAGPFFAALSRALNLLAASLGDTDAPAESPQAIAARLKGNGIATPVCDALARAVEACRRFAFLNTSDGAILRRSLNLAEEAFGAASQALP
ncbi:MAG TPA: BatD family protein [Myxococcales bacterium]|jgi:hypothetical protein|nr:BatD family protein [Myxococcales bacterium]